MKFKVTNLWLIQLREEKVPVPAWGILVLKAVVWRKAKVMENLVSNELNETVVWRCGNGDNPVVMKNASQRGCLENMSLQINIFLFHVRVYLSGVYKYVQEEKISYTRGLLIS